MDSLITAAARTLAAGDPLAALKRVALRDDAPGMSDQFEVGPPTRGALTCRELETRFVIRHEAFKAAQQFSRLLTVSAGGSITSRDFPSFPGVRQ
jgi:hypothetical protein